MHVICVIGFISAFIVFGVGGSVRSFVSYVIGIDGSYRDKRSSEESKRYSNELMNANGYDVSNQNEYDASKDEGYGVLNGDGYDASKINAYYHVSKTNGYDGNEEMYSEESKESKETERRVPCVNITTNQTVCLCSLDGTFTDCSRRNFTFVPKVPLETTTLNMSGNSLKFLDQDSLTNISTLSKSLKSLDVSKNQILYIENGSLSNFTVLKTLNVSVNNISYKAIENLTIGISTQLEDLMLEGLELKELPYRTMPHLNRTNLATFSVKNNSIKIVSTIEIFQSLKKLQNLDLSFNSIRYINISHAKNLNSLSLSSNELNGIPHCCRNGTKLPNLRWLFLDDNNIRDLKTKRLDCLDNLQLLNISATRIERIPKNAFSGFKSLQRITLERTESLRHIEPYAFNSSSLLRVYIRFNHIQFKWPHVDTRTILKLCPGLLKLDLSGNKLSMMTNTNWTYLLQYVTNLEYLDISDSELLFLPTVIPQYLRNVNFLRVSYTGIDVIPKGYFSPLTKLEVLYLYNNKFTTITAQDFPPDFTNHLKVINIAYNPFVCNCNLLWFIEFTKKNRHKMGSFPKHYECAKLKWETITHFKISKKSCLLGKETSEIIQSTCIAMLLLMLIMSVVYRYRWRLRYMLYVLQFNRRKCSTSRGMAFTHDVYISSADADFNTVYYQIVMELESKGLNVYFPPRDGMPGTLALRDCLDKIDDSKCIMLCLSNSYSQDNLCEFEANMALEKSTYENCVSNAIIVVVLEEICSLNVTKIIHKLTRTGDYLMWNENHASDNLFWRQLGARIEMS